MAAKLRPQADTADAAATTQSGSPDDTAGSQAPSGSSLQQGTTKADLDATVLAQSNGTAAADTSQTTPRADVLTAASAVGTAVSSSVQTGTGGAKTAADALPNFGFAVANAAAPAAATSGTVAANTVPVAGLAVTIAARAQAGSNQFDIRLDPPELGAINVHLDVDRNGQVTSHVTVDRADTLQLLQSQQPQIERALEQAGLKTADNGLQFTLRDQSFTGQNNSGGHSSGAAQLVIPDADQPTIQATQIYSRAGLGNGLDIRV